jgi:hypothetical protein
MPKTGSTGTKQNNLPKSATITISAKNPNPPGKVEVTPNAGRVHFKNKDKADYRLRLWRPNTDPNAGIDILLPAGEPITIVIKKDDEFLYDTLNISNKLVTSEYGPIKN